MGLEKRLRRLRDSLFGGTIRPDKVQAKKTETESLDAENVTDSTDGEPWETLRELGYDGGEIILMDSFGSAGSNGDSTSSDSFTKTFATLQPTVDWAKHSPVATDSLKVSLAAYVASGGGSDFEIRAVSGGDSVVVPAYRDSGSFTTVSTPWADYTPSSDAEQVLGEIRSVNNTTSFTFRNIRLQVGLEIPEQ